MSVRILGGLARGVSAEVFNDNQITRPTGVMLRRRVFDSRQDLSGLIFVDALAGSGVVGLEAWSRGAAGVHFIESHPQVVKTLRKNVQLVKDRFVQEVKERFLTVVHSKVERWLATFNYPENCIIFIDPPYREAKIYLKVLQMLSERDFSGEIWLELDELAGGFNQDNFAKLFGVPDKVFSQGRHSILLKKIVK